MERNEAEGIEVRGDGRDGGIVSSACDFTYLTPVSEHSTQPASVVSQPPVKTTSSREHSSIEK